MATTLDNWTGELLDAYLAGKDIVVNDNGPVKWPVLYMPSGEGDAYPWQALRDDTRYRSDQVTMTYLPHRHMESSEGHYVNVPAWYELTDENDRSNWHPEAPGRDYAMRRATAEANELGPLY